jgi:ketopantoate reductase
MGGYIAGYRAEAPSDVHIVVRSRDLARAREALAEIRATHTDVDWSQVDVGDPEDE